MPELDGMVALVTGAGSGIGLATARHLTAAGAAVAGVDLDPSAIEPPIYPVIADVTDDRSVRDAVRMVVDHFGRLDILVNNAGIGARGTVEENPDDEWRRVFEVNVLGIVRLTRAALPHLRQSPAPAVVNTCSVAATKGIQNRTIYSASKGAVQSLTLAMAADHLHEGIRINCVNPGTADTPWVQRLLDAAEDPVAERRALEARQPIGRLISADEIAAAITFLAGPRASGITGTILAVDGGMHSLAVRPKAG
jgi:NAD(P)-dependent dehydrogenase (short-subunit alcohol dehydrogenase family)